LFYRETIILSIFTLDGIAMKVKIGTKELLYNDISYIPTKVNSGHKGCDGNDEKDQLHHRPSDATLRSNNTED
jgi:hypothetical protein